MELEYLIIDYRNNVAEVFKMRTKNTVKFISEQYGMLIIWIYI